MRNNSVTQPSILIFGAGAAGFNALQHLKEENDVLAFVDNAIEKQGNTLAELPVISPTEIANVEFDELHIASEFFEKIREQLIVEQQIDASKIKVLPSHMLTPMQFGENNNSMAVKVLFALCQCLSSSDISYFIDAGTLLGIYRDGELIPWDDDLDLAIADSSKLSAHKALGNALPSLDRLTGGQWVLETHLSNTRYGVINEGDIRSYKIKNLDTTLLLPMVDVFIKYINGEIMDYTLASRGVSLPSRHMNNLESISFKGQQLSIPADPEGYLEGYYGDWRTPVKNWDLSMLKAAKVHGS